MKRRKKQPCSSLPSYRWREIWLDIDEVEPPDTSDIQYFLAAGIRKYYINKATKYSHRNRWNKIEVYKIANNVLRKFDIKGSYIGLGEFYIPEIIQCLNEQVEREVVNCERNENYAQQLEDYTEYIKPYYKQKLSLLRGDIFEKEIKPEHSIVDLDLMLCLNEEKLEKVIQTVNKAAANKCLLCLWTCYGHAITQDEYDTKMRPELRKGLAKTFKVLDHKSIKYRDNVIPMKVELITLQRKRRRKK